MVSKFTKIIALIICVCAVACTNGGATNPQGPQGEPSFKPSEVQSLRGFAIKGVIRSGVINAYSISGGTIDWSSPIATAITDDSGRYELDLGPNFQGQPLYLRLAASADGTTSMMCDLAEGCGVSVEFGEWLPITDPAFSLDLAIDKMDGRRPYYFSVLSHLASRLVLRNVGSAENSEKTIADVIKESYSKVSNRFGILGELENTTQVDITGDLSGLPNNAIDFTVTNIAIVGGQMAVSAESISTAINHFTEMFLNNDGIKDRSSDNEELSFEQILSYKLKLLKFLKMETEENLQPIISGVVAQKGLVSQSEIDFIPPVSASPTLLKDSTTKAKTVVTDVRQIGASLDLSSLSTISSFNLNTLLDSALDKILRQFQGYDQLKYFMDHPETVYITSALNDSLSAVLAVFGNELTPDGLGEGVHTVIQDGVTVEFTSVGDVRVFSVNQQISGCDEGYCPVDLSIQVYMDINNLLGGQVLGGERITLSGLINNINISGSAASESIELNLPNTQLFSAPAFSMEFEQSETLNDMGEVIEVDYFQLLTRAFEISLKFEFMDKSDRSKFAGQTMNLTGNEIALIIDNQATTDPTGMITRESEKIDLYNVQDLSANITSHVAQNGESYNSSLAVVGESNGERFQFFSESSRFCSDPLDENTCIESEDVLSEQPEFPETEERFLDLSVTFAFDSNLDGVRMPTRTTLNVDRSSFEGTDLSIGVAYDGHLFSIAGEVDQLGRIQKLNAVNQDGTEIKIYKKNSGGRTGGVYLSTGELISPLIDMGDWIKIMHPDGFFESL